MQKIFRVALIVTILVVAGTIMDTSGQSRSELTIKLGEDKNVCETEISVSFVELVEDSRCPIGVECIQAGNAVIRLKLAQGNGEPQTVTLETAKEDDKFDFHGYEVSLISVDPYPKADVEVAKEAHSVRISVTRKGE